MSATNNTLSYHDYDHTSYTSNVAAAARGLLKALFAVQPRPAAAADAVAERALPTLTAGRGNVRIARSVLS